MGRGDAAGRAAFGAHDDHIVAVAVVELPGHGPLAMATGWTHTISRWDPVTGAQFGPPLAGNEHIAPFMDAVTLADGRTLFVSADSAGQVRRWDLRTGEPVGEPIQAHDCLATVLPLVVEGRVQLLTSGEDDEVVRRWDALTGELIDEPGTGFRPLLLTVGGEQLMATCGPGGVRIVPLRLA